MKSLPMRRARRGTSIAVLAVVGLPILVYEFALQTSHGRVLIIFPWSQGEGMHLGDLIVLLLVMPFWLLAFGYLLGSLRSGPSETTGNGRPRPTR